MSSRDSLRPASTSVMLKESADGPELLFVRRPAAMRFLGGFHAFPGGALDPEDASRELFSLSTLTAQEADRSMKDAEAAPALAFYIAALRELFEEMGVLFADREGSFVALDGATVASGRAALASGEKGFAEVLRDLGVRLATDRLRYFTRWLAPEILPIRFDARVFIAAWEGNPDPDPGEVDQMRWMTPGTALRLAETGEILLAPPTAATVSALSPFATIDEMLDARSSDEERVIHRDSEVVRRILAPNASVMTGPGSNTYLVGRDELIVIDPGSMEPAHLRTIATAGRIRTIVVTHGHSDHFSGALELAEMTGAELAASWMFGKTDSPDAFGRRIAEGDHLDVENLSLEVLETPGHASDHLCLWLPEERSLFSGDLILGEGTTVISPPDGNLIDYMRSLEKVAALKPDRIYPGHFEPRDDAQQWIAWYISHRKERELQIINALRESPATVEALVSRVYAGYNQKLLPIAERSVAAHLEKLVAEDRVELEGESYYLVEG